jgi:magnesium transporter
MLLTIMKKHLQKHTKKTGLPPGSLIHTGEIKTKETTISLLQFSAEHINEAKLSPLDLENFSRNAQNQNARDLVWINIHGLHDVELIQKIGAQFNLHPLTLEDVLNTDQRPKIEHFDGYLFIVMRNFYYNAKRYSINSEQVSMILGEHFIITFQERTTGCFEPIRERLRNNRGHIREQGVDYLAYALLDIIVDRYFNVLEQISDDSETVEEILLHKPSNQMLRRIHLLKRAVMDLRRAVWPLRETINVMLRDEHDIFSSNTILHLRDVYDHTIHFIESLEGLRDLLGGMMDIYLSSVSNRVNMEVRALTVVTMLFMPATLITGIFGMNFDVMPLLKQADGFWVAVSAMLTVAAIMGLIFWRRQWLSQR